MKRLIIDTNIEECISCYFFQESISVCLKTPTPFGRGKFVEDEYSIPDWCPLEDAE